MCVLKLRMTISSIVISASLMAVSTPAMADSFSKGMKAYERKDFPEAQRLFVKSANPEAWFWIAYMSENGEISGCDMDCTALWYFKAADSGYHNAITAAATMFWNAEDYDKAKNLFRYGSRWNVAGSIDFLTRIGEVVPEPDLWNAHVAQSQVEEKKRQRQQDHAAYLLASLFAGYNGSASAVSAPKPNIQQAEPAAPTFSPKRMQMQPGMIMCPDGSYVAGSRCAMAPNGSYVGVP